MMEVNVLSGVDCPEKGASTEAKDLTVGVVDEDHSDLSGRLLDALNPPLFKRSVLISASEIDANMNDGSLIFVLEIPPSFQTDLLSGRQTGPGQASDVAAWSRQTRNKAAGNRGARASKNDWNDRCCVHRRKGWCCSLCDDDLNLEADKFGYNFGIALIASLRPPVLDRHVTAIDPAKLAQPLRKSGDPFALS
jgi:hypothetical protein